MHQQGNSAQVLQDPAAVDALARSILLDIADTMDFARGKLVQKEQALPGGVETEDEDFLSHKKPRS